MTIIATIFCDGDVGGRWRAMAIASANDDYLHRRRKRYLKFFHSLNGFRRGVAAREDPFVRRRRRSHRSIQVVAVVVESLLFVDFVSVARASLFIRSACEATKIILKFERS